MSDSGNDAPVSVFISYSHKDEVWLERLRPHLRSLENLGGYKCWDNRKINPGATWFDEIKNKIASARAAIALISPDFLASDFCMKEEIPYLLERAEEDGLLFVPVLIQPCLWKRFPWLKTRQMLPRDGVPLADACNKSSKWNAFFVDLLGFVVDNIKPIFDKIPGDLDVSQETGLGRCYSACCSDDADFTQVIFSPLAREGLEHDPFSYLDSEFDFPSSPPPEAHPQAETPLNRRPAENPRRLCDHGAVKPTGAEAAGEDIWGHLDVPLVYASPPPPPPTPTIPIDIDRLPTSGRELFGRKDELAYLDEAWESASTTVVSLVAWGGVGKSALVNRWLEGLKKQGWGGAERVFGWSFYSQGSHENAATSADEFIDTALRWFGDADPAAGSAWVKGERLADLVRAKKTLLVLDGLEPLQWATGDVGRVKDPALATLLEHLAERNPGLVLITTRQHVAGLEEYAGAVDRPLDWLTPAAGRALLRTRGVSGDDATLEAMSASLGNHALAVSLLARFLTQPGSPGLAAIPARPKHDCKAEEGPPRRVLQAFAEHLGEGPERQVLRLLGLFDRPAASDELQALRAPPAIAGLTDRLEPPGAWEGALTRLRALGLIAQAPEANSPAAGGLDAHPLVRTHFADDLPEAAAQAGHDRLYRHLTAKPAKDQPDTVADLRPLYLAIPHGVAAGHAQAVYEEVFQRRIRRGDQAYCTSKFGAYGAVLAALAAFFHQAWLRPLPVLREGTCAFLLSEAGYYLRALNRLAEAVEPSWAGLEMYLRQQNWRFAARSASNLSELLVTLGRLPEAVAVGRQAVELADRGGDAPWRMVIYTTLAEALCQSGELVEAGRWLNAAERILREWQPVYPLLYSLPGFCYCGLLLDQGQTREVRRRAAQTLAWAKQEDDPLSIALDHLSLGRAEVAAGDVSAAAGSLECAVDGLRRAGVQHHLPRGLLARAAFRREQGEFDKAGRDLAEVRRIATRGGMRLHLIDAELEEVRLRRAAGRVEDPEALGRIRAAIAETGYHRRDTELAELEATVNAR